MKDFQPATGDRRSLTAFDLDTLDNKVLPTARKWVATYEVGSPLHEHAMQTLRYWGEEA
jgi:hypothetical protein